MNNNILTFNLQSLKSTIDDNVAAMDTPYYVSVKKPANNLNIMMIIFTFINDGENKNTYKDNYLEIKYGVNSGKVYEVCMNVGVLINGNEIKKIRKELDANNNRGKRFENNLKSCMEIVREIITKEEVISG